MNKLFSSLSHVLGLLVLLCGYVFVACSEEEPVRDDKEFEIAVSKINGLEEQVDLVKASISDLQKVDEALQKTIDNLTKELTDLQNQMEDLKAAGDSAADENEAALQELEQKITSLVLQIVELQEKDNDLKKQISDLQKYVNDELQSAEDWASATFATIEQYGEIQTEISAIKLLIEQITSGDDERFDALMEAISDIENSMKAWVNATLAQGYYDIATIDAMLASLESRIGETYAAMEKQIKDQKAALEQAKEALAAAYMDAIKEAIETNNGLIDSAISDAIADVLQDVSAELDAIKETIALLRDELDHVKADVEDVREGVESIKGDIEDIRGDIQDIYKEIDAINGQITDVSSSVSDLEAADDELQGLIDDLEDKLAALKEDFEVWAPYDYEFVIALNEDVQALAELLEDLQEKEEELSKKIEELFTELNSVIDVVQSVVYMPEYANGSAYVNALNYTVEMSFKLSPSSVVTSLKKVWSRALSVKYLTTQMTKAAPVMKNLPILSATFDETVGTVTLVIDCMDMETSFYYGDTSASASLFITDGKTNISSDFVPLLLDYTDLSLPETANCYIVSEPGRYQFMAAIGNSFEKLTSIARAEVLWESFGTDAAPSVGDLIRDVKYYEGNIIFHVPEDFKEGNAVIAARDAHENILWSWHIWLTDQPEEVVYKSNAGVLMDRNLGATSAAPGDVCSLGLLYQWGRKDPFLNSSEITSWVNVAKSTAVWPASVQSDAAKGTVEYSVANPMTFISRNAKNQDWLYTGSDKVDNTRWAAYETPKPIYDPCPPGWRVPEGGINGVWAKSGFDDTSFDKVNRGMSFSIVAESVPWYPASGSRSNTNGALSEVGTNGRYWSVTPSAHYAYSLYFSTDRTVNPSNDSYRASGYSVRCVKK